MQLRWTCGVKSTQTNNSSSLVRWKRTEVGNPYALCTWNRSRIMFDFHYILLIVCQYSFIILQSTSQPHSRVRTYNACTNTTVCTNLSVLYWHKYKSLTSPRSVVHYHPDMTWWYLKFVFHKIREISWLVEWILTSQEVFISMEFLVRECTVVLVSLMFWGVRLLRAMTGLATTIYSRTIRSGHVPQQVTGWGSLARLRKYNDPKHLRFQLLQWLTRSNHRVINLENKPQNPPLKLIKVL
jgi:hypothetical protein